jgi:hypothetical protein
MAKLALIGRELDEATNISTWVSTVASSWHIAR